MPTLLKIVWIVLVLALASAGSIVMMTESPKDVVLYGVENGAERPALSASGVFHEKFQPAATTWFEQHWGLRGYAVRTDNTINDDVFRETRMGQFVVLGRRSVQLKDEDVSYYNRTEGPAESIAAAEKFARVQTRLRAKGTLLLPVIIPSKTTFFRDELPDAFKRDGAAGLSDRNFYGAFVKTLEDRHAVFVDGRAILEKESALTEEGRLGVFTRTGRHWTTRAACRVIQAIADAARPYIEQLGAAQVDCTLVRKSQPTIHDEELDLQRHLNTWEPLPADVAVYEIAGKKGGEPFRIPTLIVGSSFMWKVSRISRQLELFGPTSFFYYNKTVFDTEHETTLGKVEPHTPAWRADTSRRLIIVDVLESYLPGLGQDFLDDLESDLDRAQP